MEKKVVGLTHFSVLQKKSGKYVAHNQKYEDYVDKLFSESRLDLKSDIFFKLSLAQMQKMDKAGCDFLHLILFSRQLPEKYKQMIRAAVEAYSFISPVEIDDYESFDIKEELSAFIQPGELFAFYSLDDDDVLSVDYLQKTKRYVEKGFLGFNVVLSKGYSGFYDGLIRNCREVRFPFINIGQARICERSEDGSFFIPRKGSHMKTDETCPTVLDSRSPTFFWFRHLVQDTFTISEKDAALVKINRDLDEYPYPKESILRSFPALEPILVNEELTPVSRVENVLLDTKKERKVVFDGSSKTVSGEVVVKYKINSFSSQMKKQALAVFETSPELTKEQALNAGLQYSKVGCYRYFNTAGESIDATFKFLLPDHVVLVTAEAMMWGENAVELTSFEILN